MIRLLEHTWILSKQGVQSTPEGVPWGKKALPWGWNRANQAIDLFCLVSKLCLGSSPKRRQNYFCLFSVHETTGTRDETWKDAHPIIWQGLWGYTFDMVWLQRGREESSICCGETQGISTFDISPNWKDWPRRMVELLETSSADPFPCVGMKAWRGVSWVCTRS